MSEALTAARQRKRRGQNGTAHAFGQDARTHARLGTHHYVRALGTRIASSSRHADDDGDSDDSRRRCDGRLVGVAVRGLSYHRRIITHTHTRRRRRAVEGCMFFVRGPHSHVHP